MSLEMSSSMHKFQNYFTGGWGSGNRAQLVLIIQNYFQDSLREDMADELIIEAIMIRFMDTTAE